MTLSKHSKQIFKYVISGGSAAVVNLSTLYVLTEFFHVWYLVSASTAFVGAFAVSFTLQKFWTFKDHETEGMRKQLSLYLAVILVNLAINALFVYLLVEHIGIWYMLAQIISGLVIAIESFFIYKFFIFKRAYALSLNAESVSENTEE